jgi:CYTH domain-containing protein
MIEKERKFLLKYLPQLGDYFKEPQFIKQGYLLFDKGKQLRIRIINDNYYQLCFKKKINQEEKFEIELDVSRKEGSELYSMCECKLEKKRFKTFFHDYKVDIDIYPSGLSVVELEFNENLDKIPDYCGQEITGIKEYSNLYLAKKGKEIWL